VSARVAIATAPCLDAVDANDDGAIDCSDAVFVVGFLFLGTAAPPAPGPSELPCGADPVPNEPSLGCASYTNCGGPE